MIYLAYLRAIHVGQKIGNVRVSGDFRILKKVHSGCLIKTLRDLMRQSLAAITALVLVVSAAPARAQRSPLLSDGVYGALVNEISGDIAFEHIRWLTHYHRPMGGSEGFEAVAKYVSRRRASTGSRTCGTSHAEFHSNSWSAHLGDLDYRAVSASSCVTPETALSMADYSRRPTSARPSSWMSAPDRPMRITRARTSRARWFSPAARSPPSSSRLSGSAAPWASSTSR